MGALSEGIKTGLGVSQFLGQRQQFEQKRQLQQKQFEQKRQLQQKQFEQKRQLQQKQLQRQSEQLDIQNQREDEDRQIEAAGIEFENAANFIKGGYAGYSPAGVRAFSKAQFTLMRRVGGDHLKNVTFEQVLAGNMADKRNMKDFRDLIIKSGDAAVGQDEDTRAEILERVSEIAGGIYSPFGAPGQERQAKVQQTQLLEAQEQLQASLNLQNTKQSLGFEPAFDPQDIETDGVTGAQRVPPTALQTELDKPENALLKDAIINEITRLEGGGEDEGRLTTLTDELRKGAEGGAGSGQRKSLLYDPNVSQIELSIRRKDLARRVADGDIGDEDIRELEVLNEAQKDIATNIPGLKTAARTTAKEEFSPLPQAVQKGVDNLITLRRITARIKENFNPDFVGKADVALGAAREFTGNISAKEVTFRKDVAELGEIVLRMRSGAQINESEFKRITKVLSRLSDQENVFVDSLQRTVDEISAILQSKITLATTPKNKVRSIVDLLAESDSKRNKGSAESGTSNGAISLKDFRSKHPRGSLK